MKWALITISIMMSVIVLTLALMNAHANGTLIIIGSENPLDAATLALTAATLVVTGIGVVVAIVTIWGFKEIKNAAIKAAQFHARRIAIKVARDTAAAVAARTILEGRPTDVTPQEARAVVESLEDGDQ